MSQMSSVTYFYLILDCGLTEVSTLYQQVEVSVRRQLFVGGLVSAYEWSLQLYRCTTIFADSPSS